MYVNSASKPIVRKGWGFVIRLVNYKPDKLFNNIYPENTLAANLKPNNTALAK